MKRRKFIEFIGKGSLASLTISPLFVLESCTEKKLYEPLINFNPLRLKRKIDNVVLVDGFDYNVVVSAGAKISNKDTFGEHNDYIACFPNSKNEAILWVNNEYYNPLFLGTNEKRTKENIDKERYAVGGSIIKIVKNKNNWVVEIDDKTNKRITGETKIPFLWNEKIAESDFAEGTLQRCNGRYGS